MPACRRKYLNADRLTTAEHGRQVQDHATGLVGNTQLEGAVQILGDVAKLAGNRKDYYLTNGAGSDLRPRRGVRTPI